MACLSGFRRAYCQKAFERDFWLCWCTSNVWFFRFFASIWKSQCAVKKGTFFSSFSWSVRAYVNKHDNDRNVQLFLLAASEWIYYQPLYTLTVVVKYNLSCQCVADIAANWIFSSFFPCSSMHKLDLIAKHFA